MKICAIETNEGRATGIIEGDTVYYLEGNLFDSTAHRGDEAGNLSELNLLAPANPSKIVCAGKNYAAHAAEFGGDVPTEPLIFFKPPSSLTGHGAAVELLPEMGRVDHEAELVVVIGKQGRDIEPDKAFDYVFGYTIANDISERDYQKSDGQWTRAKGFDTFCPLGPWIDTDLDPTDVEVSLRLNGEIKQKSRTSLMVYDIATLISHISHIMTLEPGDIILTGTPEGVSPIKVGDEMIVHIEGLGELQNSVTMRS